MVNIPIKIHVDFLWGEEPFEKSEWGPINYLVGPNGTGKSIFIEHLQAYFTTNNKISRIFSSDRLADWTKQKHFTYGSSPLQKGINFDWFPQIKQSSKTRGESNDAFVILRERLDIRIKIEATLSQLLNRTLILEEKGGFMNPKIKTGDHGSYSFKENESNGLKEIITFLTLLYDDSYNYCIIDEPELHLHPQYQNFIMQEIRKQAGDPEKDSSKKCFFIVTHSPNVIDIRTIDELKNTVIFQPNRLPTYITELSDNDKYKLNRLLPRLNTHHKQFFFSTKPVFVEGNTDQQIFSLIQEKRGKFLGASGNTIIDVNGKEELDFFFRLCRELDLDSQIICDLDVLLKGNLRQSVASDERCKEFLQSKGISSDFFKGMHEIWSKLDECSNEFEKNFPTINSPEYEVAQLHQAIIGSVDLDEKRYAMLLGIQRIKDSLKQIISTKSGDLDFISGRLEQIIEACKKSNVFILPKGELENYFSTNKEHYNLTANLKTSLFLQEIDFLLTNTLDEKQFRDRYDNLIDILDLATKETIVNFQTSLSRHIHDFIYKIQTTALYDGIVDLESLKKHPNVNYDLYQNILEIIEYTKNKSSFNCKIKIKKFERIPEKIIDFNNDTNPTKVEISSVE